MPSCEPLQHDALAYRLGELTEAEQHQTIGRVFIRLYSIYGSLWSSRYPTEALLAAAKAEWRCCFSP